MTDVSDSAEPKKKGKKGLLMKILLGVTMLGVGGGGAVGLMAAGIVGNDHHDSEPEGPGLVRKGEADPYLVANGKKDAVEVVHGDGGSRYRTAYFNFTDSFTSNLKNSPALVQVSLTASTQRDGRVLMWLGEHELALRSRVLVELADTDEASINSEAGRARLQKRLADAINHELQRLEGFGGVDNVLFTQIIVQ
ncbi:flagellar basal body-associated FliL family protein [Croceibacterium ferulae]|uniref:flagellar basal body-associated FliL family protein n=1 Tax=Croceibacterium ferulae TaxID=1854641 RepID=UPI000EAD3B4D|nr:flagellar basal body-associated FliL family protein [Croceibacterium ferulae]